MRRYGFTLIELLVVIAIIAILAAILFPVFARARDKARESACLSNAKQIAMAQTMYAQDYDGKFCGSNANWEVWRYGGNLVFFGDPNWDLSYYGDRFYRGQVKALNPYIKNYQVWVCPSERDSSITDPNLGPPAGFVSYIWFTNWVWNNGTDADGFPDTGPMLGPPDENEPHPSRRLLYGEGGIYGWEGPSDFDSRFNDWYNHMEGYNGIFMDGHAKLVTWGQRTQTLPDTGWYEHL